jgi:acyl-CoA synthetase (NDP forming)
MAFGAPDPPRGGIGFVTQSGALGSALMSRCWEDGIGFATWVCAGTEMDLTVADYLIALVDDPTVAVIAMFLEAVRDPARFRESCAHARAAGKPVVVFKTGYSAEGQRAVQSHTAAIAGDAIVYDAALRQFGVVQARTLQGLVDTAAALAWQPPPRGRRMGVVSASGGACSVIADLAHDAGLEVPRLSDSDRAQVGAIVPAYASSENPIDVTMEITTRPTMVAEVAEVLVASPTVDALVVLLTTNADPPATVVAEGVARVSATSDKPILVVRVGADFLAPRALEVYRQSHIPVFPMPERAIAALRGMWDWHRAQTPERAT